MAFHPVHALPSVYLITDRSLAIPDLLTALETALKAGITLVQLREKDLQPGELQILATRARKLTRLYGARLLVNGSPQLALDTGADGVQLGVRSCEVSEARRLLGDRALIGYSAHRRSEVEDAASQGADFVTFSPIYSTPSKARYGPPQGLHGLREICRGSSLPVYALGGITPDRVPEVMDAGACGVALISAVLSSTDIRQSVTEILRKIPPRSARGRVVRSVR